MIYTLFSPAKINLFLHILAKRNDAYHDIDSVFAKLDFGDCIEIEDKKDGIEILAKGDFKIPTNAENLAYKAAHLMRLHAKGKKGIRITIDKKIPIGGGLGGGSSNAASVMTFLNTHWNINLTQTELCNLGKTLGADVPFFLCPQTFAHVSGIGDKINPFPSHGETLQCDVSPLEKIHLPTSKILLVIPNKITVPSAWAYAQLQTFFSGNYPKTEENTFEPAIFDVYPDLRIIKQMLLDFGAQYASMTGSGSVIFGIFDKTQDRDAVKGVLEKKGKTIDCLFLSSEFFPLSGTEFSK